MGWIPVAKQQLLDRAAEATLKFYQANCFHPKCLVCTWYENWTQLVFGRKQIHRHLSLLVPYRRCTFNLQNNWPSIQLGECYKSGLYYRPHPKYGERRRTFLLLLYFVINVVLRLLSPFSQASRRLLSVNVITICTITVYHSVHHYPPPPAPSPPPHTHPDSPIHSTW